MSRLITDDLIDTLAKASIRSREYTDNRLWGETPVNNVQLIFDEPLTPQTKIVANAAVDFYGSAPKSLGLDRFGDIQAGAEIN